MPMDATREEIAKAFSESGYSRLPVYVETIDDIRGVIHQKDFFTATGISDRPLSELMGPVEFVLASEKISDLLRKLQKAKTHVAVVLDEYGGTYGLITMEDILEELVGEIWDEHDEVTEEVQKLDADTYRVDGNMSLDDFCEQFDIKTDSELSSVGGWIAEQLGEVAEPGDRLTACGLEIVVESVENHFVSAARVRKLPPPPEETEEE